MRSVDQIQSSVNIVLASIAGEEKAIATAESKAEASRRDARRQDATALEAEHRHADLKTRLGILLADRDVAVELEQSQADTSLDRACREKAKKD